MPAYGNVTNSQQFTQFTVPVLLVADFPQQFFQSYCYHMVHPSTLEPKNKQVGLKFLVSFSKENVISSVIKTTTKS